MKKVKSRNDLFDEIKVRMVMKIHGIPRGKAMELIAKRGASGTVAGDGGGVHTDRVGRCRSHVADDMITAEDFFSSL